MKTGAALIADALVELEVERVFGIPGAQTLELYDELATHGIEAVPTACERGAAFIACGYAGVTGQPAVLAVVPGAGLTHALSGIAEAFVDGHPMVVLLTAIRNDIAYRYQLHEMDQAAVVRPVSKGVLTAKQPGELRSLVHQAWRLATTGAPGPAVVEVPTNLYWQKSTPSEPPVASPAPALPADKLDAAASLLGQAGRLAIYAGAGAFGVCDALTALAERLEAPVATSLSGRGLLPEDHRLAAGFGTGPGGQPTAAKMLGQADTLLVVGARLGEVASGSFGLPSPRRVVQIDIDAEAIGPNLPVDVGIVADARLALPALAERLTGGPPAGNRRAAEELAGARPAPYGPGGGERIHPGYLFAELRRLLPRDAIVVCDSGSHTFWGAAAYPVYAPRSFLAPTDYSSMGFGVPAAIGAVWAAGDRRVVATVGDGGFRMSAMELIEAVARGRAPTVIVFNDASYGMIAHGQKGVYQRAVATDIHSPDYASLAAAFRMPYRQLAREAELPAQLAEALSADGPMFIEALIEPRAVPPYFDGVVKTNTRRMGLSEKLHFGVRMLKRKLFGVPDA